MPNRFRFDQLGLNRTGRQPLYNRRELDPDASQAPGIVQRRTGSERQAAMGEALGLIMPGQGYYVAEATVATTGGFTFGFSLRAGSIAEKAGTYPIVRLHASATDYFQVQLIRTEANGFQIQLKVEGSSGSATDETTITANDDSDYILRLTGTTCTLDDGTTTLTVSTAALGSFASAHTPYLLGYAGYTTKPQGDYPVIANVGSSDSYVSDLSSVLGVREALDTTWRLDGQQEPSVIVADGGSLTYRAVPGRPVQTSALMRFGTGGFLVQHRAPLDRYFQTQLSSTGEDAWSFVCEGDRLTDTSGTQVLVDYGDLLHLSIQSNGSVDFTTNGTTLSTVTTNLTSAQAFTIACGRNGDTLFITVVAPGGTEHAEDSSTEMFPPYLDFSRAPDCYIGCDESPDTDPFIGTLDSAALYPFETRRQVAKNLATFYYDFSSGSSADQSLNNLPAFPITNSEISGEPAYSQGPISDSAWRSVAGGNAMSESGPASYAVTMDKRIGAGPTSSRLGPLTFVTSDDKVHVFDEEKSRGRTLGLPAPGTPVSLKAVGPGVLDGAVGYGYRFRTYNGTSGPIMRLDPVDASQGKRVILGSTSSSGSNTDSELGETYGQTGSTAATGRFEAANASALTEDERHVFETYFRLPDWDDDNFKETIWHRGARSEDNADISARAFYQSNQHQMSFDLTSNWTVQCAFRYKTPVTPSAGWKAFPLFGVQQATPQSGSNRAIANADVCAFVSEGHTESISGGVWGSSGTPRLVVALARQHKDVVVQGGAPENENLSTNYFMLTFSSSLEAGGFWADGEDYNVQISRRGKAIDIQVYNATTDTWLDYRGQGNTMTDYTAKATYGPGSVPARPAGTSYKDTDFFEGWSPFSNSRTLVWGSCGRPSVRIPFVNSSGDVVHDAATTTDAAWTSAWSLVDPAPADAVHYHYRAWSDNIGFSEFQANSEKRFAAFAGEDLDSDIYADFAPIFEDTTDEDDQRFDAALQLPWYSRSDGNTAVTMEAFDQDQSALLAKKHVFLAIDEDGSTFNSTAIVMYYTALGDGTLTLRGRNAGSFNITERIWDPLASDPKYIKTRAELRANGTVLPDWDSLNWIAFDCEVQDVTTGVATLTIENMAVNGDVVFDNGFSSSDMTIGNTWSSGWIHIGGFATSVALSQKTDIAEFRMWDNGQGPDLEDGTNFDYLTGRVSENEYTGGTTNLMHYYKFQPDDDLGSTLKNYGSETDANIEGNAAIIDDRDTAGSGDDPAPAVTFPQAPHPDVAVIEVLRTDEVPIVDPDVDEDVQIALEIARGRELRSLAFIPVGTSVYTDNAASTTLGLPADELEGFVPESVLSAFTWGDRLALLDDKNQVWPSTAGAGGWESFPENLRFQIAVDESAGPATAAIGTQDRFSKNQVLVCGRAWGMLVGGAPEAPEVRSLGQSIGASNAQCIAAYSGMAFAFNGKLWAVVDGQVANFGADVQDLLPDKDQCRLASSAALASLFVIDTSSGTCLRYHFPSKSWSVEERDALDVGDLTAGDGAWISQQNTWSKEASVYGDDVPSALDLTQTGTVSSDTVTGISSSTVPRDTRVLLIDSSGNEVVANTVGDVTSGTTLTFASGALSGLSGTVTVYFGVGSTGLLLDTGPVDSGVEGQSSLHLEAEILSGDGWEAGFEAAAVPGSRAALTTWDSFTGRLGSTMTGRFQRAAVRNRKPEATTASIMEIVLD